MAQHDRRFEHNDGVRAPTNSIALGDNTRPMLLGNSPDISKGHYRAEMNNMFLAGAPHKAGRRMSEDQSLTTNRSRDRQVTSRDQEFKEAVRYLKDFQEKVKQINATTIPEQGTRAQLWEHARALAAQAPDLEVWGGGSRSINGTYTYVPEENTDGMPYYQQHADPNKWMYVSRFGEWRLGAYDIAKDRDEPKEIFARGLIKTQGFVYPGVLPQAVEDGWWQVCLSYWGEEGKWGTQPSLKFWMADQVAAMWQELRVDACKNPVISVQGPKDELWTGLYDFVALEGTPGSAPVFQHQQNRKLWLYLATDQRWWIGFTADMEMRGDRGIVYSDHAEEPGTHACDIEAWFQYMSKKEVRVPVEVERTSEERASDRWAAARRRAEADTVQIWGKQSKYGEYEFDPSRGGPADPPMYRSKRHADIWLFVATDGAWWLGSVMDADEWKPKGWMRSDPVEPGTLPSSVDTWIEQQDGTWKVNENICVWLSKDVAESWKDIRDEVEEQQVLSLEGVHGQKLNGLFDYVAEECADDGAPVFQHQVIQDLFFNFFFIRLPQDLWLYVATDCCWWVGNSSNMAKRVPKGKMYSEPLQPGTHPRDAGLWHVYDIDAQNFKPLESVSFS